MAIKTTVRIGMSVWTFLKLYRVHGPLATPLSNSSSSGSLSCKRSTDGLDPASVKYHQELHASLQAFRHRKWRPLTSDTVPENGITRCRPISARPSSSRHNSNNTNTALVPRPPSAGRPHSEPINFQAPSHVITAEYPRRPDTPRVTQGNYDTLSPRILCHLVTDPRPLTPLASYGDILEFPQKGRKGKKKKRTQTSKALALIKGEDITFGNNRNTDKEAGDALLELYSDDDDENGDDESTSDDDDDDSDNESISELERGLEPSLDRHRRVPDLRLRPEKLDHVYIPDNKRDMRRFDFDAEKVDIPPYEFECPIPSPFNKINLRLHARESTDWRFASVSLGPEIPELSAMLDRMVEMEKMQIETEEWEERKAKTFRIRRPVSRNGGTSSSSNGGGGNTGGRVRDKRCCNSCLQPACVGDCPNKRPPPPYCCEKCHQLLCRGNCTNTRYDQHMRQPRETNTTVLPPKPPVSSRNCRTCQRRHTAKYINANNVVLGRPKSAFATFSRGQFSAKPKDLRPKSAMDIVTSISEKIERLGIDSVQPPPPPKSSRPSSRNGIIPGKSYFSNLNDSLTDLSSKKRVKSTKPRRAKSAIGFRTHNNINNINDIENGV